MMVRRLAVPALLLCFALVGTAADDIEVNALFYKQVVLTVDGEQVALSVGDQRKGIKLLHSNGERAIVEIDGERRTLRMEHSVARKHTTAEEYQRHSQAKSHVIEARLTEQTPSTATFEVDYYCSNKLSQPVKLTARTLFRSKDTGSWQHTVTPVQVGRHTVSITVGMSDDATDGYLSDGMQFELLSTRNGRTHRTGALTFRFVKEWHRR